MRQPPARKQSAAITVLDDEPRPGIGHNGGPSLAPVAPIPSYAATLDQCGASIGLPGQTLDALSRKGKGPPIFKLGRRIYCRWRDFHEWIDDVATGKIDATLHPAKRRRLGITERLRESDQLEA